MTFPNTLTQFILSSKKFFHFFPFIQLYLVAEIIKKLKYFFLFLHKLTFSMQKAFRLVIFVSICILTNACNVIVNKKATVTGEISHLGKSELYISQFKGDNKLICDTIYSSESGKFSFETRPLDSLTSINIYFNDNDCWTTLFVNAGDEISISGDMELVDLLEVKGGKVNDELNEFKNSIKNLYIERHDILIGKNDNSIENPELRLAEINLGLGRLAKDFIINHPSSIASVVIIQDFFYQEFDKNTVELLNILKSEAASYPLTLKMKEAAKKWK